MLGYVSAFIIAALAITEPDNASSEEGTELHGSQSMLLNHKSLLQQFEDSVFDLTAKAYDISEPLYTCPKRGYFLVGEECVSETRVDSRVDCPPGYHFTGALCQSVQPVQWRCPSGGSLVNRKCQQIDVIEADLQCPLGAQLSIDGICTMLEPVGLIEVCPEGTIRVPNGCLAVEYHEPVFVCPPDTVAEGRKCRRELVSYKYKKGRRLSEEDQSVDDAGAIDSVPSEGNLTEELEALSYYAAADGVGVSGGGIEYAPGFYDEPSYTYVADQRFVDHANLPEAERWVTAEPIVKLKNAKKAKYDAPLPEVAWNKAALPSAKYKVKVPKKPVVPQQIVKVVSQAAEKICTVGTRYGPTCINETVLSPLKECPVPLIEGLCARRIATAPIAKCSYGGRLNCNGRKCKCEVFQEYLALPTCPLMGYELIGDEECVNEIPAHQLCPLGFFQDPVNQTMCMRRDTEPALTMFSVTYVCTDCADHTPILQPPPSLPTRKTGGRGNKYLVAQENSRPDRKPRKTEKEVTTEE